MKFIVAIFLLFIGSTAQADELDLWYRADSVASASRSNDSTEYTPLPISLALMTIIEPHVAPATNRSTKTRLMLATPRVSTKNYPVHLKANNFISVLSKFVSPAQK